MVSIVEAQNDNAQIMAFSDQMMIQVQTSASGADVAKSLFGKIDLAGLDKALK